MATNEVCRAYETKATRSGWEQYLVSFGSPLVLLTSQNDVGRAVTDCAIRFSLRSNQSELHTRRRTAGSLLKFSNDVQETICGAANVVNEKPTDHPQDEFESCGSPR